MTVRPAPRPARRPLARLLARVALFGARRPRRVLTVLVVLTLAGAALALRLDPSTGTDQLASSDSPTARATDELHRAFGDDAVVVMSQGGLDQQLFTSDLGRLLTLEGCLGGNVPDGGQPYGGRDSPCGRLARLKPARVVFGPASYANEMIETIGNELGRRQQDATVEAQRAGEAARRRALRQGRSREVAQALGEQAQQAAFLQFVTETAEQAVRYGLPLQAPRIDSPEFIQALFFDAGEPRARLNFLVPTPNAALVTARLRPDLTDDERREAIELIREAVAMPRFRLRETDDHRYVVAGAPVIVSDLAASVERSLLVLLLVAALVMALTLRRVFRARRRLLPLGLALASAAVLFGLASLLGLELTMAAVAVLPILIGLAVDYGVQLHARVEEEEARDPTVSRERAIAAAAARGAPTVLLAALATLAGFAALVLLAPLPLVRSFALLLLAGVALALPVALLGGAAALAIAPGRPVPRSRVARAVLAVLATLDRATRRVGGALGSAALGAWRLLAVPARLVARLRPVRALGRGARRLGRGARATGTWVAGTVTGSGHAAVRTALRRPGAVLLLAGALAAGGWALETRTEVVSDVERLAPPDLPGLVATQELQAETDVAGQLDVRIRSARLTEPRVVKWIADFRRAALRRAGYEMTFGCRPRKVELCPAFSLVDLAPAAAEGRGTRADVEQRLAQVPDVLREAIVAPAEGREYGLTTLSFGLRLLPLDEQKQLVDDLRERLDPPPGVDAELAGLPVLAADANARLASAPRRLLLAAAGIAAVALALLLVLRDRRRALVPLVPIALATGWSALVLWALGIPLNPMTAVLAALVVAIATEFSVLLGERIERERRRGHDLRGAVEAAYRTTGRAVLVSSVTAIAGFGVLVTSDIRMLREFGLVTVLDLTVAVAGVLVVLPAVLAWAERDRSGPEGGTRRRPRLRVPRPRLARPRRPRLRRRARAA